MKLSAFYVMNLKCFQLSYCVPFQTLVANINQDENSGIKKIMEEAEAFQRPQTCTKINLKKGFSLCASVLLTLLSLA